MSTIQCRIHDGPKIGPWLPLIGPTEDGEARRWVESYQSTEASGIWRELRIVPRED